MQELVVLLFQLLMKRKCDSFIVSMFLVNLNAFNSPRPTLGKACDLRPLRCTSLPLASLSEVP